MDKMKLPNSENELTRWFSTGFMVGGIQSVDADKHTLHGACLIRPGEALGHGVWIDKEFCQAVAAMSDKGKSAQSGLKARFGHPNMCSDALGTFLGRWKGVTVDENGFVRGDLFLSSTASESPKGDLRKYVEEMAAKEPDHFGASIVFTTDWDAFRSHAISNGAVEKEDIHGKYMDFSGFKSPDPDNLKNLPHARLAELHAADLVDDPAATDGMFSGIGGTALASKMTEWLDTHPEVFAALKDPAMLDVIARYPNEIKPFFERYQAGAKADEPEAVPEPAPETPEQSTPAAESATEPEPAPAESEKTPVAESEPVAQSGELSQTIAQLTVERDGAVTRAESAEASIATLNAERDQHAERIQALEAEKTAAETELAATKQKLAAYERGESPVSSASGEESKNSGTIFERARKNKK